MQDDVLKTITFEGPDKKRIGSIEIENKNSNIIAYSWNTLEFGFDSFSEEDYKEILKITVELKNNSFWEYLDFVFHESGVQRNFWNIKSEDKQIIGVGFENLKNKLKEFDGGIMALAFVGGDRILYFEKNIETGEEKITIYVTNAFYAYVDSISSISREGVKRNFDLVIKNKELLKVKHKRHFKNLETITQPTHLTIDKYGEEEFIGSFFVIPSSDTFLNELKDFSHVIAYNNGQDLDFKKQKIILCWTDILEIDDFLLCSILAVKCTDGDFDI